MPCHYPPYKHLTHLYIHLYNGQSWVPAVTIYNRDITPLCLLTFISFIQSFSVTVYPLQGCWGLEPIPADIGRGCGHPGQVASSSHGWFIETKKTFTLTFTPTGNLESSINLHVFGLWEQAEYPERTHADMVRTCKLHTERSYYTYIPYIF